MPYHNGGSLKRVQVCHELLRLPVFRVPGHQVPLTKRSLITGSLRSGLSSAGTWETPPYFPEKTASLMSYICPASFHHDALSAAKEMLYNLGIAAASFRIHY